MKRQTSAGPFVTGAPASDTIVLPAVGVSATMFAALILITLTAMRTKGPQAVAELLSRST